MSRALATLLMLVLHGAAWAGPVPAAEVDTPQSVAPRVLGDVAAADTAASAPSDSALAVEIIKEAEAGATTADAPRSPLRDSARAAPAPAPVARNPSRADDDPWGLRDVGKATLQWVKDAVPWLRSDDDARDGGRGATLDTADWSASALEGGQAGRGALLSANAPPHATAPGNPLSAVGYGTPSLPLAAAPEENIVRVIINAVREVLEHPMTWLVVALIAIGGIAVKKLDRRPTK
jgi:hypothetical protein